MRKKKQTQSMILVTGRTGYIGSHACVELLAAGYEVVILDNLSNSRREVLKGIASIAGREPVFVEGDIRDAEILAQLFGRYRFDAVLHFAGLKAVGESVENPLRYFENNVCGSVTLLEAMNTAGVKHLVFSSSATVYGEPDELPIREEFPLQAVNPYGRTKLMIEEMLADIVASDPGWTVSILRYFNPIGAHESGPLGESPSGAPDNLLPYIAQVAAGQRQTLAVFGNNYPTHGTGVRDYIHVVDLVQGHVRALEKQSGQRGIHVYNLGTGRGYSVLEMIAAFERASGRKIPYKIAPPRAGDAAVSYADPSKARRELGCEPRRPVEAMCADAWRWQQYSECCRGPDLPVQ